MKFDRTYCVWSWIQLRETSVFAVQNIRTLLPCNPIIQSGQMTAASKAVSVIVAVALFGAAGVCEIGGGWLVWKWRRDGWHWGFFVLGSLILVGYGVIPTLQDQVFGRTYAVYGGFFIALSFLWGWAFDGNRPDKWDAIGGAIALGAVAFIMFMPRNNGEPSPIPVFSPAPAPPEVSPFPAPRI